MNCSIEWLCDHIGILRVFEKGKKHGDRYIWCCTVQKLDSDRVILKAALIGPPTSSRGIIKAILKDSGIRKVMWERIKDGKTKEINALTSID